MPASRSKYLLLAGNTELPSPLGIRVGILASNRIGQFRSPRAFAQILFVNAPGVLQMLDQILLRAGGQHRHLVLCAGKGYVPRTHRPFARNRLLWNAARVRVAWGLHITMESFCG